MKNAVSHGISFLFVPALSAQRLLPKAVAGPADVIVIDLEDAIDAGRKQEARDVLGSLAWNGVEPERLALRVNGQSTTHWEPDMALAARLPIGAIMIPKVSSVATLMAGNRLKAPKQDMIALLECASGVSGALEIANSGLVKRLSFGSLDFAFDLGCDTTSTALAHARSLIVMASKLGGLPSPLDGVTPNFSEAPINLLEARHSREMGFGGKLCIHPNQVEWVHEAFRPTDAEIAWAKRVLDPSGAQDGASALDGAMIDAPVRARANNILANAKR